MMAAVVEADVEIARQQWQAAVRRLEGMRSEPRRYHRLLGQAESLVDELRRRVGQTFTLRQLVDAYRGAESWTMQAIEARDSDAGWERETALVTDVAFHFYARGASDYAP
jgi:hypothetical protein